MKKTFTKIIKTTNAGRRQLQGVHYTSDRIELTNAHVAIVEKLKSPLDGDLDILIGLDGVPSVVDYPVLSRVVPNDNKNIFVIDIKALEIVVKLYKKEFYLKLESDGTMKGQKVGEFETLEGFKEIAFDPKYLTWLIEYAKESGQKEYISIELHDRSVMPAVVNFEEEKTYNTFVITPIRTED